MTRDEYIAFLRTTNRALSFIRHGEGFSYDEFRDAIGSTLTAQELSDAREWLSDLQWNDTDDEEIATMPAITIVRGVSRNFDGGLAAFIASNNP